MTMFVSVLSFFVTMAVLFALFGALLHINAKARANSVAWWLTCYASTIMVIAAVIAPWFVATEITIALG